MQVQRSWFLLTLAALACCAALPGCGGSSGGSTPTAEFLTADAQGLTGDIALAGPGGTGGPATSMGHAADAAADLEQEIAEADLFRVHDGRLFLLNAWRGLAIVDLEQRAVIGRLTLGGVPEEFYFLGQRAIVVIQHHDGTGALLDVSLNSPAGPALVSELPLAGVPLSTRRIGDRVLVASLTAEGTSVQSFGLTPGLEHQSTVALAGRAERSHVTQDFFFLAENLGLETRIDLVDCSAPSGQLAVRGSILVPGSTLDDEKLHFGAGFLRVVTRVWDGSLYSLLTVIDVSNPDLPVERGTLTLGQGEQLFATRFDETKAYIVTFEQVDPLWVVDLANPDAPVVAGELIVPGWSAQLVVLPDRLVALGTDPTGGWHTTVSLFDVSNPAAPFLRSRVNAGPSSSSAFSQRKAFGVFPDEGLVVFPMYGPTPRLVVVDMTADALTLRGHIETGIEPLRGFPHAAGLCALTPTKVVIADPTSLAVTDSVLIAEDVVDQARLVPNGPGQGRLVTLAQDETLARIGPHAIELYAERLYPHGRTLAVTGFDATGRAAYVLDYTQGSPTLSPRIDLGQPGYGALPITPYDVGLIWFPGPAAQNTQTLLTPAGRLIVRGTSELPADITLGTGELQDGFLVLNIASKSIETRIEVRGAVVTGAAIDGESLALTLGRSAGLDDQSRPMMRHGFRRIDLHARTVTTSGSVPGGLLAIDGDRIWTLEEQWSFGWSVGSAVAASRLVSGGTQLIARRALPPGSFDLRVAGSTLYYSIGAFGPPNPTGANLALPWFPPTEIQTLRLDAQLLPGPTINLGNEFVSLLLAEESGVLVVRNGVSVERFDISGAEAQLEWSRDVGTFPRTARADGTTGRYLLSLGLGGSVSVP